MSNPRDPLALPCGLTLPNRVMKASMSEARAVPLAATGGFRTEACISGAIEDRDCDVVGIARPTALDAEAARSVLTGRTSTLRTHEVRVPLRNVVSKVTDPSAIESVLGIGWHTDQLHRMGNGLAPDPDRGRLNTLTALVRRNGRNTLNPRRGTK